VIDGYIMNQAKTQNRPVVSLTVSPRTDGVREILWQALSNLAQHDSSIAIGTESDGHFIVGGVSESHLESIRQRIPPEYMVQADVSQPKVIYLETIRKQAIAEGECIYRYGTQNRMYAKVKLRLEPLEEGSGYEFIQEIPAGTVPPEFVVAVDSAIQDVMKVGILAGQEIVDLRAVFCDGSYNREDSDESAFKIAASIAFKEAIRKADPVVLEPIMAVEITGPEEHLIRSAIIGDLKSRRGRIVGSEHQEKSLLLRAIVPMAEMIGYGSFTGSNTKGHAQYSTRLIRFAEALPRSSGGDETGITAIEPDDPKPDSGTDEAGVPALRPSGPKPKSHSAADNLGTESM
jgi:elongation factor G